MAPRRTSVPVETNQRSIQSAKRALVLREVAPKKRYGGSVVYTPRAKNFIKHNPGIIKDFLELRRGSLTNKLKARSKGTLVVEPLARGGYVHSYLWKVSVGGKCFFVKEQNDRCPGEYFKSKYDLAHQQISALAKARTVLEKFNRGPNNVKVDVANYWLGWTKKGSGKRAGSSFLVTDFYEGRLVSDYGVELPNNALQTFENTQTKLGIAGFQDCTDSNCFWLPKEKKLVFIDLRKS